MKWAKYLAVALIALATGLLGFAWVLFGNGADYPDLSGDPQLPQGTIEAVVTTEIPVGNAAVSSDGRIFFTAHPEANPAGPRLFEWVDGTAVPYPGAAEQSRLFQTPLGLTVDRQNRLWIIDPANHGIGQARLTAIDLAGNTPVHTYDFSTDIAPIGSFLQDHQVSSDGKWVYIADVGFWAKRPAIIVYDVENRSARRLLSRHRSVYPQNYLIRNQIKDMSFFGGLLEMKTGVDGIVLSRDDVWLYYAAMNHDTLIGSGPLICAMFHSTKMHCRQESSPSAKSRSMTVFRSMMMAIFSSLM